MARHPLRRELTAEAVEGRAWRGGAASPRAPAATDAPGREGADPGAAERDWYVTVDELLDATAVLRVTPWPVLDARGRLRFPERDVGFTVEAAIERLRALADSGRAVSRPLRVGDVFRARMSRPAVRHGVDFTDLLAAGALEDVSGDAREAAKTQYSAAVSPVLAADDAYALYRDMAEDEPPAGS